MMEEIAKFNKKYTEELREAIECVLPTLKEAFIKIYGEDARDYITYTIDNLSYIYFASRSYLEVLLEQKVGIGYSYLIRCYLKYLDNLSLEYQRLQSDDERDRFLTDNYVLWSNLERKYLDGYIWDMLEEDTSLATNYLINNEGVIEARKVVMLPILAINLKTFIHEVDHTLGITAIGYTDSEIISPTLFLNPETEELANDYIAELVLQEYTSMGGVIPKAFTRFKLVNLYEEDLDLLHYFFAKLGHIVLDSYITGDHNKVKVLFGEENFREFCNLVQDAYWKSDRTEEDILSINQVVDHMSANILNTIINDTEVRIKELKAMGYRVRSLG